jgi:hypothetical protein
LNFGWLFWIVFLFGGTVTSDSNALPGALPVKLQELKDALRTVDPSAVLVSHRLLARIIQEVHHLPTQFLQVPHHKSLVIDRQTLFRYVEQDELDLDPDRLLPTNVILLVRPYGDEANLPDRQATLLKYWQRLFHATIDRALDQRVKALKLTHADLRARIGAIGELEFNEIRNVLAKDLCLLPPVDDATVYCEFAAMYLELRYFLPNLRSVYFPALRDLGKIDKLLTQDVDADDIYKATRLPGAPDPRVRSDSRSDDSHDFYWKLVRDAGAASKAGNHARAAILRMKASRVAPGALTLDTRTDAHLELQRLTQRMQRALALGDGDTSAWHVALVSLLEKADQGPWTIEARLLYDLQQVCIDHERDVYKLDAVEWLLSAGKKPIKRPLPSQRLVQMTRHLHSASLRIPAARLSDNDRQHLTRLMQSAMQQSEERLRTRFRPIIADAFHDVGLRGGNLPEETAFRKMIEELLDRTIEEGFFTFGDLRDVISRNSLKLPDLADPQEFVRGDPLLRLDRRLATQLDGVYRPGEIYLRLLAQLTSLFFGTAFGRFCTKNVLLPFGGALATIWGLEVVINEYASKFDRGCDLYPLWTFIPVGFLVLGLMYLPRMRRTAVKSYQYSKAGAVLALQTPGWLVALPPVQRVWRSWLFQLLWWYVLKPLLFTAIVWGVVPDTHHPWVTLAIIYGAVVIVLNSRLGHAASEVIAQALSQFYDKLRSGLIEGLIRWIMYVLKMCMDALERLLYSIDEWLRFRSGDSKASLVLRVLLGVIWYPIAFFTRLYIVILVEPMFHPLKLPIAILAAKLTLPLWPEMWRLQSQLLSPLFGERVAGAIAVVNTWLSADLFGFLFWELKENWRLYRANRPPVLKPVAVGHHGETVLQLLRPGFHSGTVPRLFNYLRHAEREAMASGQWRTARSYRQSLHQVEAAVRLFVEREFLVLLGLSRTWKDQPLRAGTIELATRLIRLQLEHGAFPGEALQIAFNERAGWLAVQIEQVGWLPRLSPALFESLTTALAGLYKLAGVAVVREQVQAGLVGTACTYSIEHEGLALHCAPASTAPQVFPINDTVRLMLGPPPGRPEANGTLPAPENLVFARVPVRWQDWVAAWEREEQGLPPRLLPDNLVLVPVQPAPLSQPAARGASDEGKGFNGPTANLASPIIPSADSPRQHG